MRELELRQAEMRLRYGKAFGQIVTKPRPPRASRKNVERHLQALALWLTGATYQAIGEALGVTSSRAQQMIRPEHEIRIQIRNRAKGRCERCRIPAEHGHLHHKAALHRTTARTICPATGL